jgi:hypothetical protein
MTKTQKTKSSNTPIPDTKKHKMTRPWQGTLLAILNIIGLIITAILLPFTILMALAGGALSFIQDLGPIFGLLLGGGGIILTIILIIYFILGIFITKGLFQGKRWAIILLLIFSAFSLFSVIFDFTLFSFILLAFFLYLEISCLMHPFYGNKK